MWTSPKKKQTNKGATTPTLDSDGEGAAQVTMGMGRRGHGDSLPVAAG